jgi:hypothetical protein
MLIYQNAKKALNSLMEMTNDVIRRENLLILLKETGGKKKDLAEKGNTAPSYISQILTKNEVKRRRIGDDLARSLETGFGKPRGWMDVWHPYESKQTLGQSLEVKEPGGRHHYVPVFDIKLQAGITGFEVDILADEIETIFLPNAWFIKRRVKPDRLIGCKIIGDSMEPTLHPDDIVVINLESTTPKDGKVFAINYEGQLVIKRMMRDQGLWWLQSDNPNKTKHPNKVCEGDLCLIIGEVIHCRTDTL